MLRQEGEFLRVEATSKEDAQRLWQRERRQLQETLQRQKEQMMEDNEWLAKEERLLVGSRASLTTLSPLCVSVCPTASTFSAAQGDAPSGESLSHFQLPDRSRCRAVLKLNAPQIAVPKRGSMSIFYKVNLPVLLQDPMGSEENVSQLVGVHINTGGAQGPVQGIFLYKHPSTCLI